MDARGDFALVDYAVKKRAAKKPGMILSNKPGGETNEAGLKDAEFSTWYTLSAPHGTPAPVLQQLSQALDATLADAGFRQFLLSLGAERLQLTPAETRAFVLKDRERMQVLLKSMGQLAHD